ncbi:hypothetical protein [Clostridium cylindrosporum]|uniref:Adhesin domain-containing protein n=1 Tax=Clostridium cylindrosporum DSM 605 TaxID=1121307 RepID=A0A0J8DD99_CLOCY|nr:hypothetical protein [Clostridium cylindrosporum]KMT22213.1 hypothetical protein CLCY_4c01860 [Clostridium cylindrosporum DSM 605]
MSKTKKALILSAILIVIGIIGAIPSGFIGIPKLIKQVEYNIDNISAKEKDVQTFSEDVDNLKLDFDYSFNHGFLVELRSSKDNLIHVKTYEGFTKDIKLNQNYDKANKTLSLKPKLKNRFMDRFNISEGIASIATNIYTIDRKMNSKLIIELPKGVNIDVNSLSSDRESEFIVVDNKVLKDYVNITSPILKVKLPYFNSLKKINIDQWNDINLDFREFINASDVSIKAGGIKINSGGELSNYNISKLPEKFSVVSTGDIEVNSFIPLGKNVNIATGGWANIQMPFDKYNLSGKIECSYASTATNKEEFLSLKNMKLNMDKGLYQGKYSSAAGPEYKMNISTGGVDLSNESVEGIENYIRVN